jgi:Sulfotransferase family
MIVVQDLLAAAREQTGLADLGDAGILVGLNCLVDALNSEARLSERGEKSIASALVNTLANRLRVEDYLARHPELLERPVEKPLFVFGLPRTGTTLTINLLSQDPARRCFLRWEAFDSIPPPTRAELHAGPRFDKAQALIDMSLQYAPHISAMHHEDGDSPTECQFSMAPSFCAQYYEAIAAVPSYRQWWLGASYLPAFRYQKRLFQLLQSEAPGRWTLKNPWHALYLDDLTAIYPDAQLVMTHRDPVEVVASACSLIKHVRAMFSDSVDAHAIGQTMLDTFEKMIERSNAYRQKHGADSIHDIHYAEQMRDPIGEMKRLYRRFDEPWTDAAETSMSAHLAANPKGRYGKHDYALEEYGLSKEQVRERFSAYCLRFDIPH